MGIQYLESLEEIALAVFSSYQAAEEHQKQNRVKREILAVECFILNIVSSPAMEHQTKLPQRSKAHAMVNFGFSGESVCVASVHDMSKCQVAGNSSSIGHSIVR